MKIRVQTCSVRPVRHIVAALAGFGLAATCAGETPVTQHWSRRAPGSSPTTPLVELQPGPGLGAGLFHGQGRRDVSWGGARSSGLRSSRWMAHLDLPVVSFAHIRTEAGWVRSEFDGGKGDGGVSLGFGAEVNLGEMPLRKSPLLGRTESVGLGAEARYLWSESNLPRQDLDWHEMSLAAFARYERNRRGLITSASSKEPTGVAMRIGVEGAQLRGHLDGRSFRQRRDTGLLLGADLRWTSNWTTGIRASYFSDRDRDIRISLSYFF